MANDNGGYKGQIKYQGSFVGYFPAENPKYSCIVVVYNPRTQGYYGGDVALPVFKDIADKVFSTNLDMHKELVPSEKNIPIAKNGNTKATVQACASLNVAIKKLGEPEKWSTAQKEETTETLKTLSVKEGAVPNVMGMGLRDAMYLLETNGLQVRVVGRGTVTKQSVSAGSKVNKGQWVTIELS
jgi:cell division protein FtsI (penicillin-binding protein 3)